MWHVKLILRLFVSSHICFMFIFFRWLCLSSSAGEQIGQSEHRQAYAWEPEREHKGLVTVAENL